MDLFWTIGFWRCWSPGVVLGDFSVSLLLIYRLYMVTCGDLWLLSEGWVGAPRPSFGHLGFVNSHRGAPAQRISTCCSWRAYGGLPWWYRTVLCGIPLLQRYDGPGTLSIPCHWTLAPRLAVQPYQFIRCASPCQWRDFYCGTLQF